MNLFTKYNIKVKWGEEGEIRKLGGVDCNILTDNIKENTTVTVI